MSDLLSVEDVHASIERTPVLRGVSLRVGSGETVALIGRNGAGKTTTFRSVMGRVAVTEGTIRIRGEDVTGTPSRTRVAQGVGFAPEDRRLFTDLSVRDNLRMAMWGSLDDVDEATVDATVERVEEIFPEMADFLERPAGQLSGGQQKMVAIGRALSADPDLLLLDEPFEGLAPSVRERVREGIDRIKELDVSILLAESNVRHATEAASRFYVIDRGEIVSRIESAAAVEDDDAVTRIFEGA